MKKFFKSISVLVLSLALAVSGLTFVQTAKADAASDWQANAVKTPTVGSLVGAGYIDVEFDNSLQGYTYEVFLDGNPVYWKGRNIVKTEIGESTDGASRKTFTTSDTPKTEVYTTGVSSHQITVKATRPNNPTYISNPVTFYVSKKGLAMGDNMGTKVSLQKLNCSWYYNWGTKAFNNSIDNGVSHMPMMWGAAEENVEEIQNLQTNSNYILGFNEPDIESQANFGFWTGIDAWNNYIVPLNMRTVSPAPAAPGGDSKWLKDFMFGEDICQLPDGTWDYYYWYEGDPTITPVHKDPVDIDTVDSVCLHSYRNTIDATGIVKAVDQLWNTYHKPIWITEIGLFGMKGTVYDMSYELEEKRAEIQNYLQTIVQALDSKPYVERYCWFPYDVESANAIDSFDGSGATSMFEYATGLYTDLGKMYSRIGNPSGYNANTIPDSETFNWNNRVKTEIEYNMYSDKSKVTWAKGALANLSKVDVTIDDEPYTVENGGQIDTSQLDNGKHNVEFTLYENGTEVLKRTRAFTINRSAVPSTEAPTETTVAPTKAPTVKPTVKPIVKPGKATIKAKNVKKKSVKLSWSAVSGATKYKVQWAMNKKFTKKLKSKIVSKPGFKVTKLKKKKTYFFRVGAMNSAGIGPWSNVKKIKIKK